MVCDGPSKTGEDADNRCNAYKRAVSSADIDTFRTIGILTRSYCRREVHSEVLSCRHKDSNEHYSFMERGGIAGEDPHLVNPNNPGKTPIIMPSRWRRRINAMRHTLLPSYTSPGVLLNAGWSYLATMSSAR
jgi:hypothetical protein